MQDMSLKRALFLLSGPNYLTKKSLLLVCNKLFPVKRLASSSSRGSVAVSGIYDSGQWEGVYLFMTMCMFVQDPDDCTWKYLVQDSEPGVLRVPSLSSSPSQKALVGGCSSLVLPHTQQRKGGSLDGFLFLQ